MKKCDTYHTLMMEYACGALDQTLSLMMASHLTLSPAARREMALLDCLGGALIDDECAPVAMAEHSLQSVLGRLAGCAAAAPCSTHQGLLPDMPRPLCEYISARVTRARWRAIWPGLRVMPVPQKPREAQQTFLIRARPGAKAPRHRHAAAEFTLVLQGGFRDESGSYRCGDLIIMEPGTIHTPVADAREGCACLVVTGSRLPRWMVALAGL